MKILILNSLLYSIDGKKIHQVRTIKNCMIYDLALAFHKLGHEVTLVAALEYAPIEKEIYPFEVLFFKSNFGKIIPLALPLHISLFFFLLKQKCRFDFVLSSEVFSFNSLFASLIVPKKTIIWQELGQHYQRMKKMPSLLWYNIVAKGCMRKVLIIPRSPKARHFLNQFGLSIYDDFIDHGVNTVHFRATKLKQKQLIIVSRLVPKKNIISMLQIYENFLHKYKLYTYILYIAGDGESRQEIESFVTLHSLEKQIILLGKIPHEELGQYLSNSACLLCNTLEELNMVTIGESVATGTPVLTNTVPYSHVWIQDYELGIAKDNWSEEDIYNIISNPRYIDNCLSYSSNLSVEKVASKFIQIWNNEKKKDINRK